MFQSTHPRGVRLRLLIFITIYSMFQSTHPRGVRRWQGKTVKTIKCFNPRTHEGCDQAPTALGSCAHVSIHAPTRGATFSELNGQQITKVSIHAPTRGATGNKYLKTVAILFQSTHPRGVRLLVFFLLPSMEEFQSTHPRGVRQPTRQTILGNKAFQSTHPRGVRPRNSGAHVPYLLFQSTHPRGVRLHILQNTEY